MITIQKVNVYMVPPVGGGDRRLVIDRGNLSINIESTDGHPPMMKAFDRVTGACMMTLLIKCIDTKVKNVISQAGNQTFVKGQTIINLKTAIFIDTQMTSVVLFRMDLQEHRRFNSALDLVMEGH